MSLFTDDKMTVSKSFAEAIVKTATSGIEPNTEKTPVTETAIQIPGYGIVDHERALKEAQISHSEAQRFLMAGNHKGASYHHKRAAMFHDALADAQEKGLLKTESSGTATVPLTESKEPDVRRAEDKNKRAQSLKNKLRDKQKNERKGMDESAVTEGFKGIKHGDRVTFKTPHGEERTGTANGLLVSHSHCVVDCGGRHGTPAVVNDKNYVSHKAKTVKEDTVTEGCSDPAESRVAEKFRRAQSRRMKGRDGEKKEKREEKYK